MKKQGETKRERFVRMAEARTTKVISMLRLLGNCSNQSAYEYSKTDVTKILQFTAVGRFVYNSPVCINQF